MDTAPLVSLLRSGLAADSSGAHSLFPGAVCGVDRGGDRELVAVGEAFRYADLDGTLLPEDQRTAVTTETVYDLASLTKLFTAILILQLVEQGELELDAPIAKYLANWSDRPTVTIRQLLTHTSGLPAVLRLWEQPDTDTRIRAILGATLEADPGSRFCYSCVGYLNLGLLFQAITG